MENNDSTVMLTDNAAKRIAYLLSNETPDTKLRISVDGGGCSGFQYKYDLVQKIEAGDLVLEKANAIVLIDEISKSFIEGCTIDYVETLGDANFEIRNPKATTKCGCGNSFSI